MDTPTPQSPTSEADPRFPSGEWTGFYLHPTLPGKHWMELRIAFADGRLTGDGRDPIGTFRLKGRYQVDDGRCWWTKTYDGQHSVAYTGYNEGKGIWGNWEIHLPWRGGFRIWPVGMADPTIERLAAEAEAPAEVAVREEEPAGIR